ncbi:MAG: methyltransferase domain-containing protein [Chamaesiphon sp.]
MNMTETKVRSQYDQIAALYDQRWKSYIVNTLLFLKNWAQISPQDTVLDVACGTGEFERLLLSEHPTQHIVGVDISEKMLAIAQQKCQYPNVEFQTASATALPFASNSFDAIVSASAFHYFDDPLAALAEMKRVLKPSGKVFILDWCKDYLFCKFLDVVLKVIEPGYKQCYTQEEFHSLLALAGFNIVRATKVRFGVWGIMLSTAVL